MGVKFGMEEGTQGRLALRAMLPVINAPQGRIPARFSRNLQTSYLVSGALTVNIWMEPSVCGGDVVLCQITLTTCFELSFRGCLL